MIKKITFKNFFSFKDTTIDLKSENILIGINGSGKSNFIKALKLLSSATSSKLKELIFDDWGSFDAISFSGNKHHQDIILSFEFEPAFLKKYGLLESQQPIEYILTISSEADAFTYSISEKLIISGNSEHPLLKFDKGEGGLLEMREKASFIKYGVDYHSSALNLTFAKDAYPVLSALQTAIRDISLYSNFDTNIYGELRKSTQIKRENKLSNSADNLLLLLYSLRTDNPDWFELISEKVRDINPEFKDIDFNSSRGWIELNIREKGLHKPTNSMHLSDGTLKFLCLMSIFYNPNRGSIICIDEPETGLHPDMISTVTEGIKHASKTSQVIIATHSDLLLNHFQFSDILVFRKDENNSTQIDRLSKDDFKWMENEPDRPLPGQLWRDGALGGNRW